MYARRIGGEEYTFGVSGKLIMNTLVMYDHQTGSLWGQLLGRAVEGPLAGTPLEILPAVHTTWEEWTQLYPQTLVLNKRGSYRSDAYANYYLDPGATGVIGETTRDDRLPPKEYVIGVLVDAQAKAYPFRALNDTPVVNDTFAGRELLIFFAPDSATGLVWDRRLGDRLLTFELASAEDTTLRDVETGSLWRGLTGEAIQGPLAGQQLTFYPSTYAFWFGWKDWYPSTEVYGIE